MSGTKGTYSCPVETTDTHTLYEMYENSPMSPCRTITANGRCCKSQRPLTPRCPRARICVRSYLIIQYVQFSNAKRRATRTTRALVKIVGTAACWDAPASIRSTWPRSNRSKLSAAPRFPLPSDKWHTTFILSDSLWACTLGELYLNHDSKKRKCLYLAYVV